MMQNTIQENNLLSIKELFDGNFFRIPDYQRGYSWGEKEFEDLWNDIIRLLSCIKTGNCIETAKHYVGMLTLKRIENLSNEYLDNNNSFYIVDGQQRITSIIIILGSILKYAEQKNIDISIEYISIEDILKTKNISGRLIYRFGYSSNRRDESDKYFNARIYEWQKDIPRKSQYFINIDKAAKYVTEELNKINENDIKTIIYIIVEQLVFNIYCMANELDENIIFETMNNRGKPLTNLELLKNRLMYLSTFLPENDGNELRLNISQYWKEIYINLNYEGAKDDDYLKAHWIVYKKLDKKTAKAYINDIFDKEFSINKFSQNCDKTFYNEINKYAKSLSDCSKYWAFVNNPIEKSIDITNEEKDWIQRLSKISPFYAKVSIMVILAEGDIDFEKKKEFYETLEKFIFIFKFIEQNRNDFSFLISVSGSLFSCDKKEKEDKFNKLIDSIKNHEILRLNRKNIIEAIRKFSEYINNQNHYFFKWNGLRYFLYEYDKSLTIQNAANIEWYKEGNSIEHILPQTPTNKYWQDMLEQYGLLGDGSEQQEKIINSLGNLLLLSTRSENSSLQNYSFPTKKEISVDSGKFAYNQGPALQEKWRSNQYGQ